MTLPFGKAATPSLLLLTCAIAACDGQGAHDLADAGTSPGFDMPPPAAVLATRAIDADALEVAVTLDGRPLEPTRRDDGTWRVSATVPEGESVAVEITWTERVEGRDLPIAVLSRELGPFSADARVEIDPESYDTAELDTDGDGRSNLLEREMGSDPFNANDPGDELAPGSPGGSPEAPSSTPPPNAPPQASAERVEVAIYPFDPSGGVPFMDGGFDDLWQQATFSDREGNNLLIDRLLIDENAEAADGEAPYTWFAMHDFEFLYLFVQSERDGPKTPFRDSERFFDDDAVNVFFDGDASRGATLEGTDGGDDRYVAIPLLAAPGEEHPPVLAPRPDVAPVVPPSLGEYGVGYGVCLCEDTVSGWEMRIALADLDIEVGRPFGFEVQIDQDRDGGPRDARWGWANPSLSSQDGGFAFESPAFSGTVVLLAEYPER